MPDKAGAFLQASRLISSLGANITRISYNKAVDTHTMFIDVSGSEDQLRRVSDGLWEMGYYQNMDQAPQVLLLECMLPAVAGSMVPVLELVNRYKFNISYVNCGEAKGDFQSLKLGLFVENHEQIRTFLDQASQICEVRIIDYDGSERVLDNTVFYISFANQVAAKLNLSRRKAQEIMAQSNRIMQRLDELDEPFYKTFDYISRFADQLVRHKGENFQAQISRMALSRGELYCIQPPCGSNTCIIRIGNELLFIDCGFALYAPEMVALLRQLFPDFDRMRRCIAITHPDIDHCGLLPMFDEIYVSYAAHEHFLREHTGEPNAREMNPAHAPYIAISRILSKYIPPEMAHLHIIDAYPDDPASPLSPIGHFDFQGLRFDLYRGNGGHVEGEVAIVCEEEQLLFSGDIVVNIDGFSRPQAAFNRLAPYLMSSVNMDSRLASVERKALLQRFPMEKYLYLCGHGAPWDKRTEKKHPVIDCKG